MSYIVSKESATMSCTLKKDELCVKVFPNRDEMGKVASLEASEKIKSLLKEKKEINIIFAAAPSQNDFLRHLIADKEIEWSRVNAFHMDEYIGLDTNSPQTFGNFLKDKIFGQVPFKNVFYIDGQAESPEIECVRYTHLLAKYPIDIVCLGIGENGHIAFNDPPIADFKDPIVMKVVKLDQVCRQQQVNDNCFVTLKDVPTHAYTLTIPALLAADYLYCIVPAGNKAQAVYKTLHDDISEMCPATILRTKKGTVLYLDNESSALL